MRCLHTSSRAEKHQSGKRNPPKMERKPLTWRTRIKRLGFFDKKAIVSLYYWIYHANPDEMLNGAMVLSQHSTHAHCS
jgi:hypothetical protein